MLPRTWNGPVRGSEMGTGTQYAILNCCSIGVCFGIPLECTLSRDKNLIEHSNIFGFCVKHISGVF